MSLSHPKEGKYRILISAVVLDRDDHVLNLDGAQNKRHISELRDVTDNSNYTVPCYFDFMQGTVEEIADEFRAKLVHTMENLKGPIV